MMLEPAGPSDASVSGVFVRFGDAVVEVAVGDRGNIALRRTVLGPQGMRRGP